MTISSIIAIIGISIMWGLFSWILLWIDKMLKDPNKRGPKQEMILYKLNMFGYVFIHLMTTVPLVILTTSLRQCILMNYKISYRQIPLLVTFNQDFLLKNSLALSIITILFAIVMIANSSRFLLNPRQSMEEELKERSSGGRFYQKLEENPDLVKTAYSVRKTSEVIVLILGLIIVFKEIFL